MALTHAGTAGVPPVDEVPPVVGAGGITVLDRVSGQRTGRWELPGPVHGLALSRDGRRVYAGGTGRVTWLDAATGARSGEVAVSGLTALRHVV